MKNDSSHETESTKELPETIKPDANITIEVESVKELLEAIKPGADITIKSGYYNLSEYIEEIWDGEGVKWNESHRYVKLMECYDGVEIVVERTDGISIRGGGAAADTEIVTDPRYAAVLNFSDCYNIKLSSLTMGHTEIGNCSGNVLNFTNCKNIELKNMDIYGCGVYGIGAYKGTNNMLVLSGYCRLPASKLNKQV